MSESEDTRRLVALLEQALAKHGGDDRYLTAEEVAERLAVSSRWVYDTARSDAIPHFKFGRQIRFDWTAVRAWADESASAGRTVKFRKRAA
jgi:excisionase family DNA binding protein